LSCTARLERLRKLVEIFDAPAIVRYAGLCGWTLARAHAKSGNAAMISGYLGNSSKFDEAIASLAMNYADQNERDQAFLVFKNSRRRLESNSLRVRRFLRKLDLT
jgi:hypothetical protein